MKTKATACGEIFGRALKDLDCDSNGIPFIQTQLQNAIRNFRGENGLLTEGIFRISGNKKEIDYFAAKIDRNSFYDFDSIVDIHTICGLLKQWLRRLPTPLCQPLLDLILNAFPSEGSVTENLELNPKSCLVSLRRIVTIDTLGDRYSPVECLLMFLYEVSENAEANRMHSRQLGIVFGPTLFGAITNDVTMRHVSSINSITQILIENAPNLFDRRSNPIDRVPSAAGSSDQHSIHLTDSVDENSASIAATNSEHVIALPIKIISKTIASKLWGGGDESASSVIIGDEREENTQSSIPIEAEFCLRDNDNQMISAIPPLDLNGGDLPHTLDRSISDEEDGGDDEEADLERRRLRQMSAMLQRIDEHLREKRSADRRPFPIDKLSQQQIIDEKLAIQRALIRFENHFGRPKTKNEKDLARPLYERYRSIKRLCNCSNVSVGSSSKSMQTQPINNELILEEQAKHAKAVYDQRLQQIKDDKKALREVLRAFEVRFEKDHGRKPLKEDKQRMKNQYLQYKQLKVEIAKLNQHINER